MPEKIAELSERADAPVSPDQSDARAEDPTVVAEDLLVEEVSIDGMCGVY